MSQWFGSNWHLEDATDSQSHLSVIFGFGLLDEPLEQAGTLASVVATIRDELARPVEIDNLGTRIPEVFARVSSDSTELRVRGDQDTVAAAWSRLPDLFKTAGLRQGVLPLEVENSYWPADILRRTGKNAAALTEIMVHPHEREEPARQLFGRLDPTNRTSPVVFYTNEQSLVGHVYPIRTTGPATSSNTWADGTTKRTANHGTPAELTEHNPLEVVAQRNELGAVHGNDSTVLLSLLVPLSETGLIAEQVLRSKLEECAQTLLRAEVSAYAQEIGMGDEICVIFLLSHKVREDARRQLIHDFSIAMKQIPNVWIADTMILVESIEHGHIERLRALHGLAPQELPDAQAVSKVIVDSFATLHAAVVPDRVTKTRQFPGARITVQAAPAVIEALTLPQNSSARQFRSWAPSGFQGSPYPANPNIYVGPQAAYPQGWEKFETEGTTAGNAVDLSNVLAVMEDDYGNLCIADDKLRMLTLSPALYRRSNSLRKSVLEAVDSQIPRLQAITQVTKAEVANWRRQRNLRILIPAVTLILLMLVPVGVMMLPRERQVPGVHSGPRINVTETAELNNGVEMTSSDFRILKPKIAGEDYTIKLDINACLKQNEDPVSINPADFTIYTTGSSGTIVPTKGDLTQQEVAPGECVTGSLTFVGMHLDDKPRLVYTYSDSQDAVWYTYGNIPEHYR